MKNHKKLKLGLILNSIENIRDSEINLLFRLFKKETVKIEFIIDHKIENSFKKKSLIEHILFKLINTAERKFCNITRKKEKIFIKNKKKIIHVASKFDKKKYKDLDLVIDLSNEDYECLKIDKKIPIWKTFTKQKNLLNYPGFFESYLNKPSSECELYEIKNGNIFLLDLGIYSTQKYWMHNAEFLREKSVNLFLKNINLLIDKVPRNTKKNSTDFKKQVIKKKDLFTYIFKKLLFNFIIKLNFFFIPKKGIWKIHFISKKFSDFKLGQLTKFLPPINYYWADPFLIKHKKTQYIFFENFDIKKNKGKISVIEIKNNKIDKQYDVLDKNYHLSYPFIYYEKNIFYLLPESSQNNSLAIWKSIKFPKQWKIHKILFKGESCADPTLLKDKKGQTWLFVNKTIDKFKDHNSELYIYKVKDMSFKNLIPHKKNPVIINSGSARSAGNIFYKNNSFYRPAQVNLSNIYGKEIIINKIIKLDLFDYLEIPFKKIKLKNKKIHHLSTSKDAYCVDVFD